MLHRASMAASALLLLAGLSGCDRGSGAGGGRLVRMEPPRDWRSALGAERTTRRHEIRNGMASPLTAEEAKTFPGLDFFPPDESFYYVGPILHHPEPERFDIVTSAGKTRPCEKVGWVEFEQGDHMLSLQVYRLLDTNAREGGAAFFLPFMDATTGDETYPGGRYVDLVGPPGGPYVLDFNRAYNPLCAYAPAERFACPVTPRENRLTSRIEAGERGYVRRGDSG
jgi:uncharacterized protein (DUF1684 family)